MSPQGSNSVTGRVQAVSVLHHMRLPSGGLCTSFLSLVTAGNDHLPSFRPVSALLPLNTLALPNRVTLFAHKIHN